MKNIIQEIENKYPELVNSMRNSSHHYSKEYPNKFHLEDDVWTHVKMVANEALTLDENDKNLLFCALYHDIGKPLARYVNEAKKQIKFTNHEAISAFLSLDYIKDLDLNEKDIEKVFFTISNHDKLYKIVKDELDVQKIGHELYNTFFQKDALELLVKQTYCDLNGRIYEEKLETDLFNEYIYNELLSFISGLPDKVLSYKENQPTIHFLIGPPCSGKSTYCKNNLKDYIVISRDDIVNELGGRNNYADNFKMVNNEKVDIILKERYLQAIKDKKNIAIDMTNMSYKSRSNFNPVGYHKTATIFLTPHSIIMERNLERKKKEGKYIPEDIILGFYHSFEMPNRHEIRDLKYELSGFDKKIKIVNNIMLEEHNIKKRKI